MKKPTPPRWATRLLHGFCSPELVEEMEGDLDELFRQRVEQIGVRKARFRYGRDVLSLARPFVWKRQPQEHSQLFFLSPAMLRNYLLIAGRTFWRNKLYSGLNLAGLALGSAVCLLMLLFVQHEFSYDSFHQHAQRIFSVNGKIAYGGQENYVGGLSWTVAPYIQQVHPEVTSFVRVRPGYNHVSTGRVDRPGERFYEDKWVFADSTFLSVFSFKLLAGNPQTALRDLNTVVITPQVARRYFGSENPIGKTLSFVRAPNPYMDSVLIAREYPFTVTGIIEPAPTNSSLDYRFVASLESLKGIETNFSQSTKPMVGAFKTFFLLRRETAVPKIEAALNQLIQPMFPGVQQHFTLTRLPDTHFAFEPNRSNLRYVYLFQGIALLVLLLAVTNYVSLSTARSTQRAKEIGVRKTAGAQRRQLITQFFGEALLTTLLAFGLGAALMVSLLPLFRQLIGLAIPIHFLWRTNFLPIALCVVLGSALIAAFYPALLLTRILPTAALRGSVTPAQEGALIRRSLIVFQFSISISLIACSLLMQRQLDAMRLKDLGLNKERLLVIPLEATLATKYVAFKQAFIQQPGVTRVAASSSVPFNEQSLMTGLSQTLDKREITVYIPRIDQDFLSTFEVEWRQKLPDEVLFATGAKRVILNEKALNEIGLKGRAVGKYVSYGGENVLVAGVIKDFHFESLQKPIGPTFLFPVKNGSEELMRYGGFLTVRLAPGVDLPRTIEQLKRAYQTIAATTPFDYFFLDDAFDSLYKAQDRLANLFGAFTALAIFISCLGLFGLVTFTAEQRVREIGVRKVLGASIASIVTLLSKDFLKLILIAIVIASPLAWYAMNRWLQDFAYKIDIEWWVFALAGVLAVGIALLTVSFQAVKAALANPVKSLRSE